MSNTDTTTETPTFAKGTWQEALQRSSTMLDRSAKARKLASSLLWKGAVEGITEWLSSTDDVNGEGLYATLLDALGTARKGDASKIKTVALAVRNNGLDLAAHPNLAKAYGEATRLTKTVREEAAEDDAAVVAILDALGKDNFDAHRAFLRAVSGEINSRVQHQRDAEAAEKKAEAARKKAEADAARKAKEEEKKAAAKAKGKAAAKKATAKPAATKAKPKQAEPVVEDDVAEDETEVEVEAPVVKTKAKRVPVRRNR
jgi:hypothetical protein